MTFFNFLTEEQQAWRDTLHRFADTEITREYLRTCDMNREYYYEAYDKIVAQGWHQLLIPESEGGIGGSEIDYVDDLIGASFRVKNPNAVASCGCGTSFSV